MGSLMVSILTIAVKYRMTRIVSALIVVSKRYSKRGTSIYYD